MGRLFIKPALALAFILLPQLAARAVACSCFPIPTPYKAFADARAVFAGKVTGQRDAATGEGVTQHFFRFAVEEAFKGALGKEVEVNAGMDSSCYSGFTVGQSYLVYAFGDSDAALHSHVCTRTTALSHAEDDVHHIRAALRGVPEPRVYGAVTRYDNELRGGRSVSLATPLAGIKIVVEGEGRRYEAVTDGQGRYSLARVPDGRYKARPVVPSQYVVYFPAAEEVLLLGEAHAEHSPFRVGPASYASFRMGWNNEIGGRVLDAEGAPVERAKAALFAFDASGAPVLVEEERHDLARGKYEFRGLTPGSYLPAVTVKIPPGAGPRGGRFYHPGTAGATRAGEVRVEEAAPASGRDIRLPKGYVTRRIAGVVVWPDGRPVQNAWVALKERERPGEDDEVYSFERADEQGRFSVQGFIGADYWAHATLGTSGLKLDSGLDLWDRGVQELKASPVRLTVGRENAPLRLVVSLPDGLKLPPADNRQENQR